MPYRDPERQREVQREATRRRRAEKSGVAPVVTPSIEPLIVTRADLYEAGKILGLGRGDGESDEAFRARLCQCWEAFLRVVGP